MKSGLLIVGIILLVAGIIAGVASYGKNGSCKSAGGQISQLVSQNSSYDCSTSKVIMYISLVVGIVGLVLLIMGLAADRK